MCDCIYAKIHGLINFDYFRAFSSFFLLCNNLNVLMQNKLACKRLMQLKLKFLILSR